jgi:predicted transporter
MERSGLAILALFGSLAVAAALVGTSVGLNFLMAWAFGEESQFYLLFRVISSVLLIGAGLFSSGGYWVNCGDTGNNGFAVWLFPNIPKPR